jgi:hypothetical protein
MDDWARNLFQINDSSHRPEKRSAPITFRNENGPKPYKKICYDISSSPLHQNRADDTQSATSTGLPLGPSTVKISIAYKVSATEALTCSSNAQTSPATLFRNVVLEATSIKSPCLLQGHDLYWFAQPVNEGRQPCLFWTSWKSQIPRERRLHSLASFLAGCGWIASGTSGRAAQGKRGVIVVDECDEACKASILDTLSYLQSSSLSSCGRAPVWVFGCRASGIPLQLYQS